MTSAAFHRMRRKHFLDQKKADEPYVPEVAGEEWEPRKGRKPKQVNKQAWQTPDEWVAAERKRIFLEHIQQLARRKRQ